MANLRIHRDPECDFICPNCGCSYPDIVNENLSYDLDKFYITCWKCRGFTKWKKDPLEYIDGSFIPYSKTVSENSIKYFYQMRHQIYDLSKIWWEV